jgi:hypothetical protein
MPYMSIKSRPGDKVVFSNPRSGTRRDQVNAAKYLKENQTYTLSGIDVHGFPADVQLVEVPGVTFNSVQFSNASDGDEQ